MWPDARRPVPAGAATAAFLLLTAGSAHPSAAVPNPGSSSVAPPGVAAWLEGDASQAALELSSRTDREGVLNRAVALLYAGEAAAAERDLAALRAREPRWTPALRWLARAGAESGSPALEQTLQALLADRHADSRDFLWVGRPRRSAEYSPLAVKQALVGYGRAQKEQIQEMVRLLLRLEFLPESDTADALAVAVCHLHSSQGEGLLCWRLRR